MVGNPICLVNRTGEDLKFVADGHHHVLKPGDNHGYVEPHAYFAMAQNPLMGSEDYYSLQFQSLVGVKGDPTRPTTPFSTEELLASYDEDERFNRAASGMAPGTKIRAKHRPMQGRIASSLDTSLGLGGNS